MKWFKHMTDMSDDPVIMELEEKYPAEGYRTFCKLMELVGRQSPNNISDPKFARLTITVTSFESKLQRRYKVLQKPLQLLHRRGTISFKKRNGFLSFHIVKMGDLKDNYTKGTI